MSTHNLHGMIVRMQSGFFTVKTDDGIYICQLRGRIKKQKKMEDLAAVGDHVHISVLDDEKGVIEEIKERDSMLIRMAPTARGEYKQILLANPDQTVFVFACLQPTPSLRMLDRFLVIAEKQQIPAVIVANKIDLIGLKAAKKLFSIYIDLGYPVFFTSAHDNLGVENFRKVLQGKLSAFAGPSGVGKTSLLNALRPGLGLEVRTVKEFTKKGRHTTTVREIFPLDEESYVADLPGIRQLSIWDIEPEELDGYYPEFREFVAHCQFSDCTHQKEPGCAVLEAVNEGAITEERFDSYLRLREEIEESQGY